MYGGGYIFEGTRLNAKLRAWHDVLLFVMSLASYKRYICTQVFLFAGAICSFKSGRCASGVSRNFFRGGGVACFPSLTSYPNAERYLLDR